MLLENESTEQEMHQILQEDDDTIDAAAIALSDLVEMHSEPVWKDIRPLIIRASSYGLSVCFTGGADGADRCWTRHAHSHSHVVVTLLGLVCSRAFIPWDEIRDKRLIKQVRLSMEELKVADVHISRANTILRRNLSARFRSSSSFAFIQRNFYQIVKARSLYAVGWTVHISRALGLKDVKGGTAWTVVMFVDQWLQKYQYHSSVVPVEDDVLRIPVYFFCQRLLMWIQCVCPLHRARNVTPTMLTNVEWGILPDNILPPRPSGCYTGIGSRDLTVHGENAISRLFCVHPNLSVT